MIAAAKLQVPLHLLREDAAAIATEVCVTAHRAPHLQPLFLTGCSLPTLLEAVNSAVVHGKGDSEVVDCRPLLFSALLDQDPSLSFFTQLAAAVEKALEKQRQTCLFVVVIHLLDALESLPAGAGSPVEEAACQTVLRVFTKVQPLEAAAACCCCCERRGAADVSAASHGVEGEATSAAEAGLAFSPQPQVQVPEDYARIFAEHNLFSSIVGAAGSIHVQAAAGSTAAGLLSIEDGDGEQAAPWKLQHSALAGQWAEVADGAEDEEETAVTACSSALCRLMAQMPSSSLLVLLPSLAGGPSRLPPWLQALGSVLELRA